MSIYSNEGETKIEGMVSDVLADLGMIAYALKGAGIPEVLIKSAVENGFEEYKNKNSKEGKDDRVSSILKKFGLGE